MSTTEEEKPAGVIVPCGWGRLIFAHTFPSAREVANELLNEEVNRRDIAFYVTDPHMILNTAPRDLFMDPSHTFRVRFDRYQPRDGVIPNVVIGDLESKEDIEVINRIYTTLQMVPFDVEEVWANRDDSRVRVIVARSGTNGEILGAALGVDHKLAFQDIENGSSLWSLAVDPQSVIPSVGEAIVRYLIEQYLEAGRSQLDLSVMHNNVEAIRLYEKLGFERIPVFAIKHCNPINEKLFTDGDVEAEYNPYAKIILHEAMRRGISIAPVHPERGYFRLTLGGRSILCRESLSDLTTAVAMSRCDDKEMTRHAMTGEALRVPAQIRAADPETNAAFLAEYKRVVVKPARGEQGRGVAVNLSTQEDVESAITSAKEECEQVLIEEFVTGIDLRVIVINYEVVAAAERRPPEVVGTGRHTVEQLIERASRRRSAATGGESTIPIDAETHRCLKEAGWSLEDTPPPETVIQVRNTANLHTGGTIHDVTPQLHPELAEASVRAARALEIPVVGMDFIVKASDHPEYWIIEANERPGLANHEPQPTAERFVDLLFPHTARAQPLNAPPAPKR